MPFRINKVPLEVLIAAAMTLFMLVLSVTLSLPIVYPTSSGAEFVGIHYIYPLLGVAVLGVTMLLFGNREVSTRFLLAFPCYAVVLFAHFNIKLWIPHINPMVYDALYWKMDMMASPLVELCIGVRQSLLWIIPFDANFYMNSFIGLFYCSFLYHATRTPDQFGKLMVAVLLLQSLGTVAYLIAPAIGPFIYEAGINPLITEGQLSMYDFYRQSVAEGPAFIAQHGGQGFTAGLAAMPSLHSAGAFLFFLFAWRYGKVLVPLYSLILVFILITAISSRWHYLIDVPAGLLLAWICYKLAHVLTPEKAAQEEGDVEPKGQVALS